MGNYVSCSLATPLAKNSRSVKVVFPTGEIRQINTPIKAAELMLEMPNYFLVNSQSLRIGKRFSPLNADEDLEARNAYVMFAMKRVNSVVTAADVGALFLAANNAAKRNIPSGKLRILPESYAGEGIMNSVDDDQVKVPKLSLDDIEEYSNPEFMHRLSTSRSKKPLMETIAEEPICVR